MKPSLIDSSLFRIVLSINQKLGNLKNPKISGTIFTDFGKEGDKKAIKPYR